MLPKCRRTEEDEMPPNNVPERSVEITRAIGNIGHPHPFWMGVLTDLQRAELRIERRPWPATPHGGQIRRKDMTSTLLPFRRVAVSDVCEAVGSRPTMHDSPEWRTSARARLV
jgi:hypothetical protein